MSLAAKSLLVVAYAFTFFLGMVLAVTVVWTLVVIVSRWHRGRKPFSLNPDWESTRDFIDSIPTKKAEK